MLNYRYFTLKFSSPFIIPTSALSIKILQNISFEGFLLFEST